MNALYFLAEIRDTPREMQLVRKFHFINFFSLSLNNFLEFRQICLIALIVISCAKHQMHRNTLLEKSTANIISDNSRAHAFYILCLR